MKKSILYATAVFLVISCTGVKSGQKALYSGDYQRAIDLAIERLSKGKDKKADEEQVAILENAFKKITERDLERIAYLKSENNPANSREIYYLITNLNDIQQRISPLLPLHRGNKEARFAFYNYNNDLLEAKNNFSVYLYQHAQMLMNRNDKISYRQAYDELSELLQINPNYQNAEQLHREAHAYGTDYVFVELKNKTHQIIPYRLERDLLDFNTYGLDDFWTEYHSINRRDIDYDFDIVLEFRDIFISPEKIIERAIDYEKEIKDGYTYQVDRHGNYVRDSLGNRIRVDRFTKINATLHETVQTKSLAVDARVFYKDAKTLQTINSYPLTTEFIFENIAADYTGDKRALPDECTGYLNNKVIPFPTNEQMLIDASSDIKARMTDILKRYKIRG